MSNIQIQISNKFQDINSISSDYSLFLFRIYLIFICCYLGCVAVSYAEDQHKTPEDTRTPVTVKARVDRGSVAIGDRIKYIIEVEAEKGIEIQPPVTDEAVEGFAVRDVGSTESGLFGKKTKSFWFLLDTYKTGKHTIPGTIIRYREKGGEDWLEMTTNEVKLEVKSMLGDEHEKADIKDIKGPVEFPNRLYLYIFSGVAAAVVIAVALYLIIRKKKKAGVVISPSRPAHEIAYEALMELEKKNYPKRGRIKDYYTALSDIVRRYIENRFHLRAPEMTTEEFLFSIRDSGDLNSEQQNLLREFLSDCDMVKFARYSPESTEIVKSHGSAKRLIDQTKKIDTGVKAA
jgi:hypothetical protein